MCGEIVLRPLFVLLESIMMIEDGLKTRRGSFREKMRHRSGSKGGSGGTIVTVWEKGDENRH